jgi:hypothetical protein
VQYRGANIRLLKQPARADVRDVLSGIRAHGGNALAINTFDFCYLRPGTAEIAFPPPEWGPPRWLIYPDIGQDPDHPWDDTTDVERVYAVAKMALDMGFERVVLKPMIDSRFGGWRGHISVPRAMRADDAEYNRLRELWPHLDYIGIDAYWPMVEADYRGPITADLLQSSREIGWNRVPPWGAGWCPSPLADVLRLKAEQGKPVTFMEIGYPHNMTAAVDPAGDTPDEHYTTELSRPLWEAAREVWEPVLDGWYAWEAGKGSVVATSHNLLGSGLEDVVWGAS